MIAFTVMCVYGFVRTAGLMAALPAYLGVWCLVTYYQFMNNYAEVHSGSKGVLLSLRACSYGRGGGGRSGDRRALSIGRELRSLKELRIKVGAAAFHYDKQLVVTVMDLILKQSVSLLMFN